MGFPSGGMEVVLGNVRSSKRCGVLGINIGKNKDTPQSDAYRDYRELYRRFAAVGDYLVVNVSSPNTPGLRSLQRSEELGKILGSLGDLERALAVPPFYKDIARPRRGPPAGDRGTCREVRSSPASSSPTPCPWRLTEREGCRGRCCGTQAREARRRVLELASATNLEVIGVGGISSFEDVLEFWRQGGKSYKFIRHLSTGGPPFSERSVTG